MECEPGEGGGFDETAWRRAIARGRKTRGVRREEGKRRTIRRDITKKFLNIRVQTRKSVGKNIQEGAFNPTTSGFIGSRWGNS